MGLSSLSFRKTVIIAAVLNFSYFVVEFYFGHRFRSVALLSDSIDFLEDGSVNLLIAFAIGWSVAKRKLASYLLAALLLVPGVTFIWNATQQLLSPQVPVGEGMGIIALGALAINLFCALIIARHRKEAGGLISAAYFSARNDAIANVLIIVAGLITLVQPNVWPDLMAGLVIFVLNADAAKQIIDSATNESKSHRA